MAGSRHMGTKKQNMAEQPSAEQLRYAIGGILKDAELSELTSRIVRNCLEETFKVSLKERRKEVDELLMTMIEEKEREVKAHNADGTGNVSDEGDDDDDDESESSDDNKPQVQRSSGPPKKKLKPSNNAEAQQSDSDEQAVNDAEIARKLHANERGLRTRRKVPVRKQQKTPRKKDPSAKGGKTGFARLMVLSPELSEILGADKMSRADVVKNMWSVIRERNLVDQKDKRFHICDDQLMRVFGTKRIKTFSMMKYLKHHVKDPLLMT